MSKHPYPEHVVEAVAEAMGKSRTGEDWGRFQEYFIEHTHVALQALWDASRVDDLHGLPDRAIYVDEHGGVGIVGRARQPGHCDMNQPSTILYWGDTDE